MAKSLFALFITYAQWDPLLNRTGQIGQTFVRDMSLLESQSKG